MHFEGFNHEKAKAVFFCRMSVGRGAVPRQKSAPRVEEDIIPEILLVAFPTYRVLVLVNASGLYRQF